MARTQSEPASIRANLLHLGYNMWMDREAPEHPSPYIAARPFLRFDVKLWNDLLKQMAAAGFNMVVIDLGEGVRYRSHPELAVKGSWTPQRLRRELDKCRKLGLEPIPKLNFSACHDVWLGDYARCLSTDLYYGVCRDLIAEVIDLFDRPRLFHLGMDEETAAHQRYQNYLVIRQFDLWWHDLYFLVDEVERGGARAWIWSDYMWDHPDVFFKKMPRSVLQSNWYYGASFSRKLKYVQAYVDLEKHKHDQVPTASNWSVPENFGKTVQFCSKHIPPKRLLGFLQTPWHPTLEACRAHQEQAVRVAGDAFAKWDATRTRKP